MSNSAQCGGVTPRRNQGHSAAAVAEEAGVPPGRHLLGPGAALSTTSVTRRAPSSGTWTSSIRSPDATSGERYASRSSIATMKRSVPLAPCGSASST
jgi:hypothetical protein